MGDGAPPGTQPDAAPGQPDGAAERLPWDEGFTVEPPVIVPELNTPSLESECFILDERTLLLSSTRPGGTGGFDMYSATRAGRGEPFTAVVELADLDSPQLDGRLVTADGLVGYFHSARPGGVGGSDIWRVTRTTTDAPWLAADAVNLAALSSSGDDFDPWPSSDDMRIYFIAYDQPDAPGGQDIFVAERSAPGEPFGPPVPLPGINTGANEDNPALSPDELFIVFGSDRPGGAGGKDLWFARRADRDSPFSPPQPMPEINSEADDWEVCFDASGEIFYSSNRPGGMGSNDIYRSAFVPPAP
ncbi:MAG TPA: hypothetical protein VKZ63_05920 [Kofleriaceae bacterium]|nr:hypothetical protein [Kofleriaceae bacterium]